MTRMRVIVTKARYDMESGLIADSQSALERTSEVRQAEVACRSEEYSFKIPENL